MHTIESRLSAEGIEVPGVPAAVANYLPWTRTGNLIYSAGALPMVAGKPLHTGKLGSGVSIEEGYACARTCAINLLGVLLAACEGDWGRLGRLVAVNGYVAAHPDFHDVPKVVNGASDLFVSIFGEAGKHSRTAVGVAVLPLNVPVEVQVIAELRA